MGAMSIDPTQNSASAERLEVVETAVAMASVESTDGIEIPATLIFEDQSRPSLPLHDPKSASLIFRPTGQGCFP